MADKISDLLLALDSPVKNKVKAVGAFSVTIHESTDFTDDAQLAIFVCYFFWEFSKKL